MAIQTILMVSPMVISRWLTKNKTQQYFIPQCFLVNILFYLTCPLFVQYGSKFCIFMGFFCVCVLCVIECMRMFFSVLYFYFLLKWCVDFFATFFQAFFFSLLAFSFLKRQRKNVCGRMCRW